MYKQEVSSVHNNQSIRNNKTIKKKDEGENKKDIEILQD